MTDDLATRLLAAIEQTERTARLLDEHLNGHDRPYNPDDPTDPTTVLRHCAAHRKVVHHYEIGLDALAVAEGTILAGACKVRLGAYENVIRALAEGYDLSTDDPTED